MKNRWLMIKRYLYGNKALAATTALAVIFLFLWVVTAQEIRWSDLFLNLLACFITSSITIGVIERITRKIEKEKALPIRQSIYRDVQLYLSRIIGLWEEMYIQSQEDRDNIPIEKLFSEEIMSRIFTSLDLEGNPNVIPRQNWFTYIENSAMEMETLSERILTRYSYNLPPELI